MPARPSLFPRAVEFHLPSRFLMASSLLCPLRPHRPGDHLRQSQFVPIVQLTVNSRTLLHVWGIKSQTGESQKWQGPARETSWAPSSAVESPRSHRLPVPPPCLWLERKDQHLPAAQPKALRQPLLCSLGSAGQLLMPPPGRVFRNPLTCDSVSPA